MNQHPSSRSFGPVRPRGLAAALLACAAATVGISTGHASASQSTSTPPASTAPVPEPPPPHIAAIWERMIGTWVADNSKYKSAPAEMDAYALEWSWGLNKKTLLGRLYGIRNGKEVGTFWQFREFWHPGERRLITTQYGSDGSYGVGPHDVKPDGSSELLQTFYDPELRSVTRIGHRSTLAGDAHTTISFDVDGKGTWKERRTYVWRRQTTTR